MTLKETREALAAKRKALAAIYEEAGPDLDFSKVKSIEGDTKGKVEKMQAMNRELEDLQKDFDALRALDESRKASMETTLDEPKAVMQEPEAKTLGDMFIKSGAIEHRGRNRHVDVDLKTDMTRAAGWAPESLRLDRVALSAQRPIAVVDAFPMYSTSQSSIKYMEETTFTNNAAERAENAITGEAALALTERTVPVEMVAVWLPVTEEQLEDVDGVRDYINGRLGYMVRAKLDSQLVAGDGSTPNLRGILNASGLQTQAKSTDSTPDAVYKAMTKVMGTGHANANAGIFHPNDWQDIRLLTTADGIYIWGSPTDAGPERIWGLPVIKTTAATENTGIVGDFSHAGLFVRRGLEFAVTDSHSTDFIHNKLAVRCNMRVAAVYFRGAAFCEVTGI